MCRHRSTERVPWASSTSCSPTRRSQPSRPRPTPCPAARSRSPVPKRHTVLGTPLDGPLPDGAQLAVFGLGCFWGAEKTFWQTPGVISTAVGYAGRLHPEPDLRRGLLGRTGHAEVVRVVFDPAVVSYEDLLRIFWEHHDPTQGMRQGNDQGTQYRSAIHVFDAEQRAAAEASRDAYQAVLAKAGYGTITTEIVDAPPFYYAEEYHQQYLDKNPGGYCPIHATGVKLPDDFVVTPLQYID